MALMSDSLNFDSLELQRVPVSIAGRNYLLEEADGETGELYQNRMAAAGKLQDGKVVGIGDIASIQSLLVSRCLWEADNDGKPIRRVPHATVKAWPNRIVKQLFDRAMEISDLSEKAAEKKPSPEPTDTATG